MLALTKYPWTNSKRPLYILLTHYSQAFRGYYISGVDESVDVSGFLVDGEISGSGRTYL